MKGKIIGTIVLPGKGLMGLSLVDLQGMPTIKRKPKKQPQPKPKPKVERKSALMRAVESSIPKRTKYSVEVI